MHPSPVLNCGRAEILEYKYVGINTYSRLIRPHHRRHGGQHGRLIAATLLRHHLARADHQRTAHREVCRDCHDGTQFDARGSYRLPAAATQLQQAADISSPARDRKAASRRRSASPGSSCWHGDRMARARPALATALQCAAVACRILQREMCMRSIAAPAHWAGTGRRICVSQSCDRIRVRSRPSARNAERDCWPAEPLRRNAAISASRVISATRLQVRSS